MNDSQSKRSTPHTSFVRILGLPLPFRPRPTMYLAGLLALILLLQLCGRPLWRAVLPISFWTAALGDSDFRVRQRALEVIAGGVPSSAAAAPSLAARCRNHRYAGAEQLPVMSLLSRVLMIIGAVDSGSVGCDELQVASDILDKLGNAAKAPLISSARNPRDRRGPAAVLELAGRFSSDPQVVLALTELLKHPSVEVRQNATVALKRAIQYFRKNPFPEPVDVISPLVRALDDQVGSVRGGAAVALAQLGMELPDGAMDAIALCMTRDDEETARLCAEALGSLRRKTAAAVDGLIRLLQHPSADVRRQAAFSLGELHAEEPRVALALGEALSDMDSSVAEQAIAGLRKLGKAARPAIPALKKAATSGHPSISTAARALLE